MEVSMNILQVRAVERRTRFDMAKLPNTTTQENAIAFQLIGSTKLLSEVHTAPSL